MNIESYDPDQAPDAEAWLALEESERVALIKDYHEEQQIKLPNAHIHATFHAIIENHLASGEPPETALALHELTAHKGQGRHEALHLLGGILQKHLQAAMMKPDAEDDPTELYVRDLKEL